MKAVSQSENTPLYGHRHNDLPPGRFTVRHVIKFKLMFIQCLSQLLKLDNYKSKLRELIMPNVYQKKSENALTSEESPFTKTDKEKK